MPNNEFRKNEAKNVSNITILMTYTIFSAVLFAETILMEWELWALPLIVASVCFGWFLHISRRIPEKNSMFIYVILMMVAFFFYGIHITSTFDLAPVCALMMLLLSMTETVGYIYIALIFYYATMIYDMIQLANNGTLVADPLTVSRIFLHMFLIFIVARIEIIIINNRKKERNEYGSLINSLEETNRRTEDFLTNVSHEFRTPINAVTGITSIIIKKVHDKEIREQIASVQRAGYRLFEQVGAILDYTEIDTGRMNLSVETYMISSTINDIITENYAVWNEPSVEMVFDVDADIPSQLKGDSAAIKKILKNLITNAVKFTKEGGVYVRIYSTKKEYGVNLCFEITDTGVGMDAHELSRIRERFYQINSGRTRRAGGLGLGLSIVYGLTRSMGGFLKMESEPGEGTSVHVSIPQEIVDPSPSMSVDDREDICLVSFILFEKFADPRVRDFYERMISNMVQRLDLARHDVKSCEELAKVQRIYKVSHVFVGASEYEAFKDELEKLDPSITLIVAADDSFSLPPRSRARIMRKPVYAFTMAGMLNVKANEGMAANIGKRMVTPGISALVVDDEAMNLMVAEGIFKDYGMKVKTVFSGFEAIKACEEEHFDIIFLDHMMPEMDGVETLKHLRTLEQTKGEYSAMVALTANAVSGAREMFLNEGFDGFVAKPVETAELERVLKNVLPKAAIEYVDGDFSFDSDGTEQGMEKGSADPLSRLHKSGIETGDGIRYCRNDKEFYMDILNSFVSDSTSKQNAISTSLANGDLDTYRIQVHALKSTSKMIGATALSEYARQMEEAAKKKDVPYLQSHQDDLMQIYTNIIDTIASCIGINIGGEEQELTEIGKNDLISRLNELKDIVTTYEQEKAEGVMDELSAYYYKDINLKDALSNAKSSVADFDMKTALSEIEGILADIEKEG